MSGRERGGPRWAIVALLVVGVVAAGAGWAWAAWSETTQLTGRATARFVAPVLLHVPEITGTPADGEKLTAIPGQWSGLSPTASRSYTWTRCTTTVQAQCTTVATGASLNAVPTGVTSDWHYVVTETITNGTETRTASSVPTPSQDPLEVLNLSVLGINLSIRLMLVATTEPTVSGTAKVNSTLTANPGSWSTKELLGAITGILTLGAPTISRQWYRCDEVGNPNHASATAPFDCTAIAGATGATYAPTSLDLGKRLRLQESYKRALIALGLIPALNVTIGTFQGSVFVPATARVVP